MSTGPHRAQHGAQGGEHPPYLHHHFDTVQQQYASDKLAMWLFLTTEILLFGGLFCVYAVYRAKHPEIFIYADRYLDRTLGGINTMILICSSFTMAWAVRAAQLGQRRLLILLLSLTILGGLGFLGIKGVEYEHKWKEGLLWGTHYGHKSASLLPGSVKDAAPDGALTAENPAADKAATSGTQAAAGGMTTTDKTAAKLAPAGTETKTAQSGTAAKPAPAGTAAKPAPGGTPGAPPPANPDAPLVKPAARGPEGLARLPGSPGAQPQTAEDTEPKNVQMFFAVYFTMTGLHALHVIAGLTVIFIMILLAARGRFDGGYFTPVDLTGLFWHLVDIVWIFLFPLLYLIH